MKSEHYYLDGVIIRVSSCWGVRCIRAGVVKSVELSFFSISWCGRISCWKLNWNELERCLVMVYQSHLHTLRNSTKIIIIFESYNVMIPLQIFWKHIIDNQIKIIWFWSFYQVNMTTLMKDINKNIILCVWVIFFPYLNTISVYNRVSYFRVLIFGGCHR